MVFHPYGGLHIDRIPDDITLLDLLLDRRHGRRPLDQSHKAVLIDAPTGKSLTVEQVTERIESLAKGLKTELDVEVGWNGVIGTFFPNSVSFSTDPAESRLKPPWSFWHRIDSAVLFQPRIRRMGRRSWHFN